MRSFSSIRQCRRRSTPVTISTATPAPVLNGVRTSAVRISGQIRRRKAAVTGWILEAELRGKSAEARQAVRHEQSRPLAASLRLFFQAHLAKLARGSPTAEAIRYALNHWDGLERLLNDGRIELDSNSVERAMRPVALSRKNSLFAGSDEGTANWAALASLIETCKPHGVNPHTYFTDLLTRLVNGWPQSRIDELMPWCSAPATLH